MPRPLRVEVRDGIYHVNAGAIHGQGLFLDDVDRSRWLRLLAAVVEAFLWECCAYCLLSTHYHVILRITEPTLARGMQYLNARHAESFNRRHERRGHVFGARYFSALIESEAHALEVCRYLPLNPVRAGLCTAPELWRWSSFAATVGLAPAPVFLRPEWVLGLFGTHPETARRRYRAFVEDGLKPQTLDLPQGGLTPSRRVEGLGEAEVPRPRPPGRRGLVRTRQRVAARRGGG
jgi:putative transposase